MRSRLLNNAASESESRRGLSVITRIPRDVDYRRCVTVMAGLVLLSSMAEGIGTGGEEEWRPSRCEDDGLLGDFEFQPIFRFDDDDEDGDAQRESGELFHGSSREDNGTQESPVGDADGDLAWGVHRAVIFVAEKSLLPEFVSSDRLRYYTRTTRIAIV